MSQAANNDIRIKAHPAQDPVPSVNASSVEVMATLLRTMGVDLGNEREVIRVLIGANFTSGQVKSSMDHAISLAR